MLIAQYLRLAEGDWYLLRAIFVFVKIKQDKYNGMAKIISVKKTRSCGYPLFALPQAIEMAKALCDGLGEGPYSRDGVARGLGYSSFSGAASSKIGSLAHFGLLARAGGTYSITSLARSVFLYPKEGSEEAMAKAVGKPLLYGKLIARFSDKPLPERLDAVLSADYGIAIKAAPVAAQNFVATLEFAGLIREGKLVFPDPGDNIAKTVEIVRPLEKPAAIAASAAPIKIKLPSGVEISFPENLAYRLSMGDFGPILRSLDDKANGGI